jgi:D-3-phosphoglycerate dehydrogenase
MVTTDRPLVLLSDRIGPLTRWESAIAERVPCQVECRPLTDRADIAENAAGATAVILGAVEPFDARTLWSLPDLRLVARRGVGVDNVDVAAAAQRGILVTRVTDATVEEVSDHALGLLLALLRGLPAAHQAALRGRVDLARAAVDRSRPVHTSTLAVLGAGRIGRRLVAKAVPLFGTVLVVDPYVAHIDGARVVPLDEALAAADAVSVHTPLTPETRGLLDAAALAVARPGLVLVNTARAGVVDEAALEDAVRAGRIAGIGLDVTADDARWHRLQTEGFGNLLLTAHTGGRGALAQENLRRRCADQVVDFLSGRRPQGVVRPDGGAV